MFKLAAIVILTTFLSEVFGDTTTVGPLGVSPQPAYKPTNNAEGYVPHATYPYSDTYGGTAYEGYLVPTYKAASDTQANQETSVKSQGYLQGALKVFSKVGLFVGGGLAVLIVGVLFTTAICSLTPLCTITFHNFGGINQESVRSLMSPDHISAAAALVQDAVGKYQRLQRAVSS